MQFFEAFKSTRSRYIENPLNAWYFQWYVPRRNKSNILSQRSDKREKESKCESERERAKEREREREREMVTARHERDKSCMKESSITGDRA